jgi:uncharacterized membrane protein YdfJ with MMPL/SSD domain
MTQRFDLSTSMCAFAAAAMFLYSNVWSLALLELAAAAGLVFAAAGERRRLRDTFRFVFIAQLTVLGALWPSMLTVAAILVLPGAALAIRSAVLCRSPEVDSAYVAGSALLSMCAVLGEATWVVTHRHH